jgi:NADH dehydrogenase
MILIAGATGTLGKFLIPGLVNRGLDVRLLTRDASHASQFAGNHVEIVEGDVRDARAVERAMSGADTVVSAITGFAGKPPESPQTVDRDGNLNLIRAAAASGAPHFVLLSVAGVAPDHPMELFRMKWAAEQELFKSGLDWSVVRPSAYMETWVGILAAPLLGGGKAMVFGRGTNPINFVSAADVARAVEQAIAAKKTGTIIEVSGPDDLGMKDIVDTFKSVTGATGGTRRIPRPMLRIMSVAARPFNPVLARQSAAAVLMDTRDFTRTATVDSTRAPAAPPTSLTEVVKRDYGSIT